MIGSERPKVREVGIDIGRRPHILKPISLGNRAAFLIILGENDDIGIFMSKLLVWRMTLNELVDRNLIILDIKGECKRNAGLVHLHRGDR